MSRCIVAGNWLLLTLLMSSAIALAAQDHETALHSIGLFPSTGPIADHQQWLPPRSSHKAHADDKRVKSVEVVRPFEFRYFYYLRHLARKDTLGKSPKLPSARPAVCKGACKSALPNLAAAQKESDMNGVIPPILPVPIVWVPEQGSVALTSSGPGARVIGKRTMLLDIGDPPNGLSPPVYRDLAGYIWRQVNERDYSQERLTTSAGRRGRRHKNKVREKDQQQNLASAEASTSSDLVLIDVDNSDDGVGRHSKERNRLRLTMEELGIPVRYYEAAHEIAQKAVAALRDEKAKERHRANAVF